MNRFNLLIIPSGAKKLILLLLIADCSLLIDGCSRRFEPEPLQLSVKQNLALLQTDPQFVMYFNFKKMRETGFWKKFISDSLFRSERNFGNFLYILKNTTGASITNGIDELYFSNSWIGDNAMVVKGTFDRSRIDRYVSSDSDFAKITYPDDILVYSRKPEHFYFYFKDDFTVCASNYLNQIESTFKVKDTSQAGLLTNADAMRIIEHIEYKDNLWMMSGQKLFIRGIFENFSELGKLGKNKLPESSGQDSLMLQDTTAGNKYNLLGLYDNINAVSFSLKMTDGIELVMQNECTDDNSAVELKNKIDAVIALSKLSSQFSKKKNQAMLNLLDRINLSVFDKTLLIEAKLDDEQITEIRKQKLF
jgi:hypothetical protein